MFYKGLVVACHHDVGQSKGGTAVSLCHHALWRDISSNELAVSLRAVTKFSGKGGEGRVFQITTAARGFLAPTGVCTIYREDVHQDVGRGEKQCAGQR